MALDLFFNMMAYYHFLIKQFSCNLNKDRKQVLENIIMVDFPSNVSMERLECQSKEAQILTWVMLSTRSSLVTQRGNPNQLRIDHNYLYLQPTRRRVRVIALKWKNSQLRSKRNSQVTQCTTRFKQFIQAQFSILTGMLIYISTYPFHSYLLYSF